MSLVERTGKRCMNTDVYSNAHAIAQDLRLPDKLYSEIVKPKIIKAAMTGRREDIRDTLLWTISPSKKKMCCERIWDVFIRRSKQHDEFWNLANEPDALYYAIAISEHKAKTGKIMGNLYAVERDTMRKWAERYILPLFDVTFRNNEGKLCMMYADEWLALPAEKRGKETVPSSDDDTILHTHLRKIKSDLGNSYRAGISEIMPNGTDPRELRKRASQDIR